MQDRKDQEKGNHADHSARGGESDEAYRLEDVTTSLDHVLTKLRIMIPRKVMLRLIVVWRNRDRGSGRETERDGEGRMERRGQSGSVISSQECEELLLEKERRRLRLTRTLFLGG